MITLFYKFLILFFIIGSIQTHAQFQNNGSGVGLDRSIGGATRQTEPEKIEPIDYAKIMTEKLTTKLQLDGFQSAVVKNLVENFVKKTGEISVENIPTDAKIEKSSIARKDMEKKFTEIFTEKQKVLFEELLIENNGKIKKGKKKKKKDSNTSEE